MGLFGGDSSSSSSATDNRTVVDAQGRAIVGNKGTTVFETGSKGAQGRNAQFRESGSVDFSHGGKLVESGGMDFSGKGNKLLMSGAADIKASKGSTVSFSTDAGAVGSAFNFASDVLARYVNTVKDDAANASGGIGQSVSNAVSDAMGGAAGAVSNATSTAADTTNAAMATDGKKWLIYGALGLAAWWAFFKGKA
jgi:hypothetical protein